MTKQLNLELEHYLQTHAKGLRWEVKISGVDYNFTTAAASRAQLHMLLLHLELKHTDSAL